MYYSLEKNNTNFTFADSGMWNSPYSVFTQVVVWFFVIVLSLETIIGNAMVIVAYKIERSISKQVSNRYIVSLAISDLIIGIEGFPLFTVYVLNGDRWPLGSVTCETWLFLDYTLCLVSILTVLLITADRYLSVCHTAKYLKWQSPTKTQVMIFLSWLIPAFVFGIMIYGWKAMTGAADSMQGAACSAPFLANPYVNMGMYVVYYWTTLVAMLILYKGIHQAAKNLEQKAKAKERRHIALILSQRLGTQVGVSLMLHQEKEKEKERDRRHERRGTREIEEGLKDSGYHTQTTVAVSTTQDSNESENLQRIEEERSKSDFKRGTTLDTVESTEKQHHYTRWKRNRKSNRFRYPTVYEEDTDNEQESLLGDLESGPVSRKTSHKRSSIRSQVSSNSHNDVEQSDVLNSIKQGKRSDSLSLLFNEEDMSSVLHFKPPLQQTDSVNDSESTSAILQNNRRYNKHKGSGRSRNSAPSGAPRRIEQLKKQESTSDLPPVIPNLTPSRPDSSRSDHSESEHLSARERERWVSSMRRRIARAIDTRRLSTIIRQRSSSESSCSSSGENEEDCARRAAAPVVIVAQAEQEPKHLLAVATEKRDTLLTPQGSVKTHRKISTFTAVTRERMINSIFSPVSFFSNRRKQTKAERRAHKAFRTITFIVGCFAILWSPYYVMATIYGFCKGECIPSLIYTLSYYMCYLNSSGNPFAYALANRQFRSAFLRMLRGDFNKTI